MLIQSYFSHCLLKSLLISVSFGLELCSNLLNAKFFYWKITQLNSLPQITQQMMWGLLLINFVVLEF